ncbi:hypothetical protein B0A48_14145 [Cryoendolithus antarcticus]|uniref:Uncharacterized protein n=1 Tax=Cryoendolithus antarcticus TaxID=1507870 RepID=A0A1V8SLW1_9PEZI|nr:hypothetical protein B0A48_14145 [Cryoendolithus antarcticus]
MQSRTTPPTIIHSLGLAVQADLLELASRFEEIDKFVLKELRDPHEITFNPSMTREDQKDLGPVRYKESDKVEFTALCQDHELDEVLPYLGDRRLKGYWLVIFNSLCTTWGRGSMYYPDKAQARIHEVLGLSDGLDPLYAQASKDPDLPRYVKTGISERLRALESFLDTALVMFPTRRRRETQPALRGTTSTTGDTNTAPIAMADQSRLYAILTNDSTTVGITLMVTTAAMALAIAAFFGAEPYSKADFSLTSLYNYLQSMLVSVAAQCFTILPLWDPRVRRNTSRWIGWWTLVGTVTGILTPAIYYVAGSAWSDLLASVSAICSAFVTLHLVQGLQKETGAKVHTL